MTSEQITPDTLGAEPEIGAEQQVRKLTQEGVAAFRRYLERLRGDAAEAPPRRWR